MMIDYLNNNLKSEFSWIADVSARVSRSAIEDLDNAFKKLFKKKSKYPKFKKRGDRDSFSIREKEKFDINGRFLRIEKLKIKIKTRNELRFDSRPKQVTISYKAGKWFASIMAELLDDIPNETFTRKPSVGVDLGVSKLAVLSDGIVFEANQPLKKKLKKLKLLQRRFSRKQKGSNNGKRLKLKISKLHYYIYCKRQAITHELTSYLVKNYFGIVIEDLNVSGMVKNRKLARAVSDVGFYEIRRQLEYKSKLYGNDLIIADRWFPSTKMYSSCGKKQDIGLSNRRYECSCGLSIDRDLNAAINLNKVATDFGDTLNDFKSSVSPDLSGLNVDGSNIVSIC